MLACGLFSFGKAYPRMIWWVVGLFFLSEKWSNDLPGRSFHFHQIFSMVVESSAVHLDILIPGIHHSGLSTAG